MRVRRVVTGYDHDGKAMLATATNRSYASKTSRSTAPSDNQGDHLRRAELTTSIRSSS